MFNLHAEANPSSIQVYVGEYVADRKHGQGKCEWPNGNVYAGMWAAGIQEGRGTLTCKDGRRYVCERHLYTHACSVCIRMYVYTHMRVIAHVCRWNACVCAHECNTRSPSHARVCVRAYTHAGMTGSGGRESNMETVSSLPAVPRSAVCSCCCLTTHACACVCVCVCVCILGL